MPTDPTAPLQLDQPAKHIYEPPHRFTYDERKLVAQWFAGKPDKSAYIEVQVSRKQRKAWFAVWDDTDMDAGELARIASLAADAIRWADGQLELMNPTPGPKEGADEPDARGGQSPP